MDLFAFHPVPERTERLDLGIRRALADSVAAIHREVVGSGSAWPADFDAWRRALLNTPRAPPRLWCRYHDVVRSIVRDDAVNTAALNDLMAGLPALSARPGQVVTLSAARLGRDADRYRAVIDNDPGRPLDLQAVPSADVARIAHLAAEARAMLTPFAPALLNEMDTLGHEIVLATNARRSFGGAATVFLWGAVILNPERVAERVTLVESLAHETAHALLFGMTLGADLTTNGPDERYASPLRPDPRPIEGIVHATYVLARMNLALGSIWEAPDLNIEERALIVDKLERNRMNYEAGLGVVLEHARFTPEGEMIFAGCRAAM